MLLSVLYIYKGNFASLKDGFKLVRDRTSFVLQARLHCQICVEPLTAETELDMTSSQWMLALKEHADLKKQKVFYSTSFIFTVSTADKVLSHSQYSL